MRERRPSCVGPPAPTRHPVVVQRWTGREATALRCAARMSVRGFAEYLGISTRAVSRWAELGSNTVPRPYMQGILDTALGRADETTQRRFAALLFQPHAERSTETHPPF